MASRWWRPKCAIWQAARRRLPRRTSEDLFGYVRPRCARLLKSSFLSGFTLTREQRTDLITFLNSLTDEQFLRDPRHANPWQRRQLP
jgi:hypothetical protein